MEGGIALLRLSGDAGKQPRFADLGKSCAILVGRSWASAAAEYLLSANGAVFISAWGDAPGMLVKKISSALKARFNCAPNNFKKAGLIRAFSARFLNIVFLGRCPRLN